MIFQAEVVEQPILDRIEAYQRAGGRVTVVGDGRIVNVEGKSWPGAAQVKRIAALGKNRTWLKELSAQIAGCKGVDGKLDGLWTCRRGSQAFLFNTTAKPVETTVSGQSVEVAPSTIWCNRPKKAGS